MLVQESDLQPFVRIVGCVDFSENSNLAVEQSARVALQDAAELHLLHVVPQRVTDRTETERRLADLETQLVAREPDLKV